VPAAHHVEHHLAVAAPAEALELPEKVLDPPVAQARAAEDADGVGMVLVAIPRQVAVHLAQVEGLRQGVRELTHLPAAKGPVRHAPPPSPPKPGAVQLPRRLFARPPAPRWCPQGRSGLGFEARGQPLRPPRQRLRAGQPAATEANALKPDAL